MAEEQDQSAQTNKGPVGKETPGADKDDCRCKEVSKKSFLDLVKLMIRDLSFWRKAGKS